MKLGTFASRQQVDSAIIDNSAATAGSKVIRGSAQSVRDVTERCFILRERGGPLNTQYIHGEDQHISGMLRESQLSGILPM